MKIIELQTKYKETTVFLFSVLSTAVIGVVNLLVNYSEVCKRTAAINSSIFVAFLGIPVASLFVALFYCVILSLVSYFVAAAIQQGFVLKKFVKFTMRILWTLPLISAADLAGFLICGRKFTSFGLIGLLSYVPFYFFTAISIFTFFPKYVNVTKKQNVISTVILTIVLIVISVPN